MLRLAALTLALVIPAMVRAFVLDLPLDCTVGAECYIQQFADHDPGPSASDYHCGTLSYDGHDGTDFALPTLAAMQAGVKVLAAAPGIVAGVRDGMADIMQGGPDAPDITGRECGNGAVIRHEDGWETQYCHLRQGSLLVSEGQKVEAGTPLGLVGLSGDTQFPHVHLSVRHDGESVDPFDPDGVITCGAPSAETLWTSPPPYRPGGLLDAGFATAVPDYAAVQAGTAAAGVGPGSDMVLWGLMFGGQAGDVVAIRITGPAGEVVVDTSTEDRTLAQFFRAAGRRVPTAGWPPGDYVGTITLTRKGAVIDTEERRITVGE